MNPLMLLTNQLQNQLKMKNPQVFQKYQSLKQNQNNPQEILNKMFGNYTPEQVKSFKQFANGFGITNEQLSQFINLKG